MQEGHQEQMSPSMEKTHADIRSTDADQMQMEIHLDEAFRYHLYTFKQVTLSTYNPSRGPEPAGWCVSERRSSMFR